MFILIIHCFLHEIHFQYVATVNTYMYIYMIYKHVIFQTIFQLKN